MKINIFVLVTNPVNVIVVVSVEIVIAVAVVVGAVFPILL